MLEQLFLLTPPVEHERGDVRPARGKDVHGAGLQSHPMARREHHRQPLSRESGGMLVDWMPPHAEKLHLMAMENDARFLANLKDLLYGTQRMTIEVLDIIHGRNQDEYPLILNKTPDFKLCRIVLNDGKEA